MLIRCFHYFRKTWGKKTFKKCNPPDFKLYLGKLNKIFPILFNVNFEYFSAINNTQMLVLVLSRWNAAFFRLVKWLRPWFHPLQTATWGSRKFETLYSGKRFLSNNRKFILCSFLLSKSSSSPPGMKQQLHINVGSRLFSRSVMLTVLEDLTDMFRRSTSMLPFFRPSPVFLSLCCSPSLLGSSLPVWLAPSYGVGPASFSLTLVLDKRTSSSDTSSAKFLPVIPQATWSVTFFFFSSNNWFSFLSVFSAVTISFLSACAFCLFPWASVTPCFVLYFLLIPMSWYMRCFVLCFSFDHGFTYYNNIGFR